MNALVLFMVMAVTSPSVEVAKDERPIVVVTPSVTLSGEKTVAVMSDKTYIVQQQREREWYFAKSGFSNHYAHYKGQHKLYFDGVYFEGSNESKEYWLGLGVYRTNEYQVKQKSTQLDVPEGIRAFLGDIGFVTLTERVRRRDFLATAQINYTAYSKKYQLLDCCPEDNYLTEFSLRIGTGVSIWAWNTSRRYEVRYGDEKRGIQNPIDRTFTKSYLYPSVSPFVRLGTMRLQADLQIDLNQKPEKYFLQDVRVLLSGGAQF